MDYARSMGKEFIKYIISIYLIVVIIFYAPFTNTKLLGINIENSVIVQNAV